jgi:FK506-binding protein 1
MGVTRITHVEGTGPQPMRGQKVTIAYTGWLKDPSKPDNKGQE